MKTKTFNKTGTVWTVLISALALLLCAALIVGVTGKTKAEYIPAPSTASDDFSGTMLSDYDNLKLFLNKNYISFNFGGVELSRYDIVVLDVVNATLQPCDLYEISFGLQFDNDGTKTYFENTVGLDSSSYNQYSGPFFDDSIGNKTITYVLDLRHIENGVVSWTTYVDGIYHKNGNVYSVDKDTVLESFNIVYADESIQNPSAESYDQYIIGALYLYGFEDASDCSIGAYIADPTLKLTDCKDSMLYTGE